MNVGAEENIGFDVEHTYDSDWAKSRNIPSIRVKSIVEYSPAYRLELVLQIYLVLYVNYVDMSHFC